MTEVNATNSEISLLDNERLITDQSNVCKMFNEYFIDIAEDLAESENVTSMNSEQLYQSIVIMILSNLLKVDPLLLITFVSLL